MAEAPECCRDKVAIGRRHVSKNDLAHRRRKVSRPDARGINERSCPDSRADPDSKEESLEQKEKEKKGKGNSTTKCRSLFPVHCTPQSMVSISSPRTLPSYIITQNVINRKMSHSGCHPLMLFCPKGCRVQWIVMPAGKGGPFG